VTTASAHPGDSSSRQQFVAYYAAASATAAARQRFVALRDVVLRLAGTSDGTLSVADLGCNAGTSSAVWAELGHRVHGLDISADLLRLARDRTREAGLTVNFCLGSATALPWADRTMHVCVVIELLEHIADWRACVDECARVLRPGGILVVSTTNWLSPRQSEFTLPLYSWYPARLKRRYEHLAATTRPWLANHATYPAVNWFSFYGLRRELSARGFRSLDRFDVIDATVKSSPTRWLLAAIRRVPALRYLAHVLTPYTLVVAVKDRGGVGSIRSA
jgi:2-polyprenyl-3-methyl-5-hydroxy-6-metoxy-1,4-benzoquinol methylase